MLTLPASLRLALVPIGVAIGYHGLRVLDEVAEERQARVDQLDAAIAARVAYLDGNGPRPELVDEHQGAAPVDERQAAEATPTPQRRIPRSAVVVVLCTVVAGWVATRTYRSAGLAAADRMRPRSEQLRAAAPAPGAPAHPSSGVRIDTRYLNDDDDEDQGDDVDPGHADRIAAADDEYTGTAYLCPWKCGWREPAGGPAGSRSLRLTMHANDCDNRPRSAAVGRLV